MCARAANVALQAGGVVLLVLGGALGGSAVVDPSCAGGDYLQVSEYESETAPAGAVEYETLTDAERQSFGAALDGASVRVDRDRVGFLSGAVVDYRGHYYRTAVVHVDGCHSPDVLVSLAIAGVAVGGALFANGRGWGA